MISKHRPDADILALTFSERVQRGLTMSWGVDPVIVSEPANTDEMIALAKKTAVERGLAKKGDNIIITAGVPVGTTGTTNIMTIQAIDQSDLVETLIY